MDIIKQAAFNIQNKSIEEWKKKDSPIVGFTCSQVPLELFYAGGILPVRLRGIGAQGLDIADAYYGPFICSFPKAILQSIAEGKFNHLNGAVIADGCDAIRRMDECWRKAGEDHKHMNLPFFHYMNIPRKVSDHAYEWFIDEIKKLKNILEQNFSVSISVKQIEKAIKVYNISRKLIDDIEILRLSNPPKIKGSDAFSISLAAQSMTPELFQSQLSKFLANITQDKTKSSDSPRILISGSVYDDLHLIQTVEKAGAHVVGENVCFGPSQKKQFVSEELPPYEALAKHYLIDCQCPRMFGRFNYRLGIIKERIKKLKADGVIFQNIRFCDLHASENGLLEGELEKDGIPCIRLEREYGSKTDTGRLRMRIDAFLERITS